ncbi:MAG: carbon-nitrogen hydrolase family protein [Microbacterium sp.]
MSTAVLIALGATPRLVAAQTSADEAVAAMIAHWRERLREAALHAPDLVLLPEYADQPDDAWFLPHRAEYLAARGDRFERALQQVAAEMGANIVFDAVRERDGRLFNTVTAIDRAGRIVGRHEKRVVTLDEAERLGLSYGEEATVFDLDIGRVSALVCFDLNFAAERARVAAERPDVVVFPSNFHGGFLQQQLAYESEAFVLSAIAQPAPSAIVDPVGRIVAASTNYTPMAVATVSLDAAVVHLDDNLTRLAELKRRHGAAVEIADPGLIGVVLVSAAGEVPLERMLSGLDIVRARDYLSASERARGEASSG